MTDSTKRQIELSRRHLADFVQWTYPKYEMTPFHDVYTSVLDQFARGNIKNLIVTIAPQHGKSLVSTRSLPAYLLGKYPDSKVVVASYAQSLARRFGREIRRVFADRRYGATFPGIRLAGPKDRGYTNSADVAEVVGHHGSLTLVGAGSGLTGNPVDYLIIDDLYKDAMEANSPVTRQARIEWYQTVAETRLHNASQQLIVFTRWHQEDLVGWLESQGLVIELKSKDQINTQMRHDMWYKINFEAIKESDPTELDPRERGEVLYPNRHSKQRMVAKRKQDAEIFDSLYQGNPKPSEGLLYREFNTYMYLPELIVDRINYTDVADKGDDYLCSVCGVVGGDDKLYIVDVLYTKESQEITEPETAAMLKRNRVETAYVESNNGGRGFARQVGSILAQIGGNTEIKDFPQTLNKPARIITNASAVRQTVVFPADWQQRWPQFSRDLMNFRKLFKANTHDDAPDAITGLYEKSGLASGRSVAVAFA